MEGSIPDIMTPHINTYIHGRDPAQKTTSMLKINTVAIRTLQKQIDTIASQFHTLEM